MFIQHSFSDSAINLAAEHNYDGLGFGFWKEHNLIQSYINKLKKTTGTFLLPSRPVHE